MRGKIYRVVNIARSCRWDVKKILEADSTYFEYLFTVTLLFASGVLLVMTTRYSGKARIVPLIVIVPTFCLLVLLFVTQVLSQFTDAVEDISNVSVKDQAEHLSPTDSQGTRTDAPDDVSNVDTSIARKQLLSVLSWVLFLPVCFLVFGTIVGSLIYLLSYYRYRTGQNWRRTLVYSVFVWIPLVVLFEFVLTTPLYQGLLQSYLLGGYV